MKTYSIRIFILLCWLVSSGLVFSQSESPQGSKTPGLKDQAVAGSKIIAARVEFNKNNIRGALTLYREVLDTDPNNSTALFGVSECHYNLKRYKLALEYLDKAVAINPSVSSEAHLYYGQIYHRTEQLDDAISHYQKYQATVKTGGYDYNMAQRYINQCNYAKQMMMHPVDVNIINIGEDVNSRYDDYAPSITADGKTLYFTSRRMDTKGGRLDKDGDYKYFEDIYSSRWNEKENKWSMALPVEGELNTETHDGVLSIFPDGLGMFVYKNTVTSTGDIYYSIFDKVTNEWQPAVKMPRPINTSYFESSISMTDDGQTVYFISERPEGLGQGDIYVSNKNGVNWSTPKNLGTLINTELDEKFVFIHPNGRTLYFASNGHLTLGGYDIFKSELVNGVWSAPVNLGYPINTVNEESTFSLSADNKTMVLAAEYDNSLGERDLYLVDVSKYKLIGEGVHKNTHGQVVVKLFHHNGKAVKGADVKITAAGSDNMIASGKTDKMGEFKATLLGNMEYNVSVRQKEFSEMRKIQLTIEEERETVVGVEFRLH